MTAARHARGRRRLIAAGALQFVGAAAFLWFVSWAVFALGSGAADAVAFAPELAVALAAFVCGSGLLTRRPWARRASLWLAPFYGGVPGLRLIVMSAQDFGPR